MEDTKLSGRAEEGKTLPFFNFLFSMTMLACKVFSEVDACQLDVGWDLFPEFLFF